MILPLPPALAPWLPFVVALALLVIMHYMVTYVLLAFFYRITHHLSVSMLLYALLVWPGTVLHEFSHWIVARLLGVYAQFPHLIPSRVDEQGNMVLGHVMVERTDIVRRSLIGVAPLAIGSAVVAALARYAFALPIPAIEVLGIEGVLPLLYALPTIFAVPNAWFFLYALFAIANAMMPSPSDREAWPALLLFVAAIGVLIYLIIGIPQVPTEASLWVLGGAAWLTFAFIITAVLDLALLMLLYPLERLLWLLGR
ncbi:MAG: hypothetical protein H0T73_02995 [Ardenticatenales bacterium]|nr:hypothetical protein [Ardenticatenales bacterium]